MLYMYSFSVADIFVLFSINLFVIYILLLNLKIKENGPYAIMSLFLHLRHFIPRKCLTVKTYEAETISWVISLGIEEKNLKKFLYCKCISPFNI